LLLLCLIKQCSFIHVEDVWFVLFVLCFCATSLKHQHLQQNHHMACHLIVKASHWNTVIQFPAHHYDLCFLLNCRACHKNMVLSNIWSICHLICHVQLYRVNIFYNFCSF
jgi:hypothetical protein